MYIESTPPQVVPLSCSTHEILWTGTPYSHWEPSV